MIQAIRVLPYYGSDSIDILKFKLTVIKQRFLRWITGGIDYYQFTHPSSIDKGVFISKRETKENGKFVLAIHFLFTEGKESVEVSVTKPSLVAVNGTQFYVDVTREMFYRMDSPHRNVMTFKRPLIDFNIDVDAFIGTYEGFPYLLYYTGEYDFIQSGIQTAKN